MQLQILHLLCPIALEIVQDLITIVSKRRITGYFTTNGPIVLSFHPAIPSRFGAVVVPEDIEDGALVVLGAVVYEVDVACRDEEVEGAILSWSSSFSALSILANFGFV